MLALAALYLILIIVSFVVDIICVLGIISGAVLVGMSFKNKMSDDADNNDVDKKPKGKVSRVVGIFLIIIGVLILSLNIFICGKFGIHYF